MNDVVSLMPPMTDIFEVMPEAACLLDDDSRIVRVNSLFQQTIARAERTVGATTLEEMIHQADREKIVAGLQQVQGGGGRVAVGRCRTLTYEGENEFPVFRLFDWVLGPTGDQQRSLIAVGHAVSIKGRIAPDARQDLDLLDFFQNAPIALHWLSEKGTVLWANNALLDTLGYSAEEYIGHCVMDFCPDDRVVADEMVQRLVAGTAVKEVPIRFRTKKGDIRYLLVDSNVNFGDDGSFRHTRCFIRDDTARIVRESVIKYEREQAESRSRDREAFYKNLFLGE